MNYKDILKSMNETYKVNVHGCMGGGIARQIANKYPKTDKLYIRYCVDLDNVEEMLLGNVLFTKENDFVIANLFSQNINPDKHGSVTNYIALRECLLQLKEWGKDYNSIIGVPHGIGCGIAGGNWDRVLKIIGEVFDDYNVYIYKYMG